MSDFTMGTILGKGFAQAQVPTVNSTSAFGTSQKQNFLQFGHFLVEIFATTQHIWKDTPFTWSCKVHKTKIDKRGSFTLIFQSYGHYSKLFFRTNDEMFCSKHDTNLTQLTC